MEVVDYEDRRTIKMELKIWKYKNKKIKGTGFKKLNQIKMQRVRIEYMQNIKKEITPLSTHCKTVSTIK